MLLYIVQLQSGFSHKQQRCKILLQIFGFWMSEEMQAFRLLNTLLPQSTPEIISAHRVNQCVRALCLCIHRGVLGQLQADGVIQPLLKADRPWKNNVSGLGTGNNSYFKCPAP